MNLSLRARLLAGLLLLVFAGLLVADGVTYVGLRGALQGRIDQQLADAQARAQAMPPHRPPGGPPIDAPPQVPPGMYGAVELPDGTLIWEQELTNGVTRDRAYPVLDTPLTGDGGQPYTVGGTGDVAQFRVCVEPYRATGVFLLVATPLTDYNSTLQALLAVEASIGIAVLAGMALLGLFIVRIGLRPLERMGRTARAIARGDYSRRVSPATSMTEIGRLGLALNGMLAQIESAFAERTRSEARLRRFIADASHELRTPLTSIRGYAELLRRGAERSPEDAELARRRIEAEAIRMSVLVDDMLLLARLDQGRPLEREAVDLWAIVRDARADASAVAPSRTITLAAAEHVVVTGDDMRLRQAVGNLVRNALVHTPPSAPIEIGLARGDGHARLTVADHGPGLPADAAPRLFEPFFRGDAGRSRDRGGAGLGLSIVSAVVAAHQGTVRVTATPGGGATFVVELPVAPGSVPGNSQPPPTDA